MNLKTSLLALLASCITVTACSTNTAQNVSQELDNNVLAQSKSQPVVTINYKNDNTLSKISARGLDLFGINKNQATIKARVNNEEIAYLKANSIRYKTSTEKNMSRRGLLAGYSTFKQMEQKLKKLASENSNIAELVDIGDTVEKNNIWCLTISNKSKTTKKPASLFIGGMHARELAPVEIMIKLAEHLVTQYGKDPVVTKLVDTRDINIVPMVNVDGRIKVENGNSWQRKNAHGVDLNRNFDSHWNYEGLQVPSSWKRGLTSPSSQIYSGPSPASEPEIKAIQGFYQSKKLNMVLDMHAYGEMFFWPVGFSKTRVPEYPIFKKMYNESFKKIGYKGGTSLELLYATTGTTDDYAYVKHKALGLGMEIGNSFRPNYSEVENIWNETKNHLLYLIEESDITLSVR